ncbi:MAG: glycosyltransferase, partial [Candidatus Aminicenantes bacterium]|nr:glycosyltransferase [Candidatus Aminicenantes bacterium]
IGYPEPMLQGLLNRFLGEGFFDVDLLERYLWVLFFLRHRYPEGNCRILDVGGLVRNRAGVEICPPAFVFPRVVSLDIKVPRDDPPAYVQGDGCRLPFRTDDFDAVLALDVLEHIVPDCREKFISELARVSRNELCLSFPYASDWNDHTDRSLDEVSKKLFIAGIAELNEHVCNGLPDITVLMHMIQGNFNKPAWAGYGGSLPLFLHHFFFKYYFYRLSHQENLDRLNHWYLVSQYLPRIDLPPFYRAYVCASHSGGAGFSLEVDQQYRLFIDAMKALGRERQQSEDFLGVVDSYCYIMEKTSRPKHVCAVVLYQGEMEASGIRATLDHLVTQDLEEEIYEVYLLHHPEKNLSWLLEDYPQVQAIALDLKKQPLVTSLLARTGAEYFYIVSEDNMTYTHSLKALLDMLQPAKDKLRRFFLSLSVVGLSGLQPVCLRRMKLVNTLFHRECMAEEGREDVAALEWVWSKAEFPGWILSDYGLYHRYQQRGKVLFATHLYAPARGGAETLARSMAETCREAGHEVTVVTSNAYSTEAFFLRDQRRIKVATETVNSVKVVRLPASRSFRRLLNVLSWLAGRLHLPMHDWIKIFRFGPRNRYYIDRILAEKPDMVVGIPFPMLNTYYAWKAARALNVPFILIPCFHLADPFSFSTPLLFNLLRSADRVIALTDCERLFFIHNVGVADERVVVVPPGIEPVEAEKDESPVELRKRLGITERNVVLCMSQHGRHKKILELVRAMKYVWQKMPDTALVIAGGTTAYTPIIKQAARDVKAKTKKGEVYFFDDFPPHEKNDLFRVADLFASLSEHESFGIVFIEAMQQGLPTIASVRSVSASIVEEYRSGLVVDPDNPSVVAGAILEILQDPEIKNVYGARAREKVARDYAKEVVNARMLGVISEVLQGSERNA